MTIARLPTPARSSTTGPLTRTAAEALAKTLRLVADPTRLQLLSMINGSPGQEVTVGESSSTWVCGNRRLVTTCDSCTKTACSTASSADATCGTRSPRIVATPSPISYEEAAAEIPAAMARDPTRPRGRSAARARQLDALAEPERLRVLSGVAARPDGTADASSLAADLDLDLADVEKHLAVLTTLELLEEVEDRPGTFVPTADTWMRFGRLVAAVERPVHPATTLSN